MTDDCSTLLIGNVAHIFSEKVQCDARVLQYLEDEKVKVVKDTSWLDSLYIRDRDCIELIQASAEDVLAALAGAKWDVITRALTRSNVTNGSGF